MCFFSVLFFSEGVSKWGVHFTWKKKTICSKGQNTTAPTRRSKEMNPFTKTPVTGNSSFPFSLSPGKRFFFAGQPQMGFFSGTTCIRVRGEYTYLKYTHEGRNADAEILHVLRKSATKITRHEASCELVLYRANSLGAIIV